MERVLLSDEKPKRRAKKKKKKGMFRQTTKSIQKKYGLIEAKQESGAVKTDKLLYLFKVVNGL